MNKTVIASLAVVSLLAYGLWNFFRVPALESKSTASNATKSGSNSAGYSFSSGSVAAPSAAAPAPAAAHKAPISVMHSAARIEFEKGHHYKQFLDRYLANPEGADAETKYLAAAAIEACLGRTRSQNGPTDAEKARFTSRLKDGDPNNQARIDAFNQVTSQCDGFQGLNLTGADAARLFQQAAAAGDPAAKMAVVQEQFRDQTRNATGIVGRQLTEDQLASVRDALSSGDPLAMQRAGMLLTYGSTQLAERQLGPDGTYFSPRDMGPAWTLASCDRGADCGADSTRVLNGCAYQGQCGYQDLQSYMQFNELAPNVYMSALQYQNMINSAIAQGHWDWLGIAPGMGRSAQAAAPTAPVPITRGPGR